MNDDNPVVILDGETWHLAENGRSAKTTHCGKAIKNQRSHSRLRTVGISHICPQCVQRYQEDFPPPNNFAPTINTCNDNGRFPYSIILFNQEKA